LIAADIRDFSSEMSGSDEDADGGVVKRDGHDFGFSGWHGAGIWSKSRATAPRVQ